ncbi:hypothetical protein HY838_00205 [Candidatus Azambacteria bacterium]|nr:hypothetical protein [Candidatus Azambacteria bacterium]
MILTSHIIASGLLGSTTKNYFIAGAIGLVSHYILDAIPHSEYSLNEAAFQSGIKTGYFKNKKFWREIAKVALDGLIGFAFLFIIIATAFKNYSPENSGSAAIGAFFGVLPDILQFLYWITGWRFLKWNSDFQNFTHYFTYKCQNRAFRPGIITQIATIAIIFLTLYKI